MHAVNTPDTDSTARLHDGRHIGVEEVGKSDGSPIFHFHGSGSSRLEVRLLDVAAKARAVRLIGLDRPGIGLSSPKEGYTLLDWPDDVAEVADRLGIDKFAVEGVSAGGPYAMACAFKIPQRLKACGLISTEPPTDCIMKAGSAWMRVAWWIGSHYPRLFRAYLRMAVRDTPAPSIEAQEKQLLGYSRWLSDADKKLIQVPDTRRGIAMAFAETRRQGGIGNRTDALRLLQPWGFGAEDIAFEKMFLWHGEKDRIMPVDPARLLARELPHCTATFYPDEGHFSTLANHADEIFRALID